MMGTRIRQQLSQTANKCDRFDLHMWVCLLVAWNQQYHCMLTIKTKQIQVWRIPNPPYWGCLIGICKIWSVPVSSKFFCLQQKKKVSAIIHVVGLFDVMNAKHFQNLKKKDHQYLVNGYCSHVILDIKNFILLSVNRQMQISFHEGQSL